MFSAVLQVYKNATFFTPGLEPPTLIFSLLPRTSQFAATFTGSPGTGLYTNGIFVTNIVFPLKDLSTEWIPSTGLLPHVVTAEYFCRCLWPATQNEHTVTFVSQQQKKGFTTNFGGIPYFFKKKKKLILFKDNRWVWRNWRACPFFIFLIAFSVDMKTLALQII